MNIYFCDLCNESVPQVDLDKGQAFQRKGRVICSRCNDLMHAASEAAAPTGGPFGGGGEAGPAAGGAAAATLAEPALGSAAAGAPPAGTSHKGAHPHALAHLRARRGGGGAGIFLGVLALAGCAAVGLYLHEKIEEADDDRTARDRQLVARLDELSFDVGLVAGRMDEQSRAQVGAAAASRAAIETQLGAALERFADETSGIDTKLQGFDARLSAMQESLGNINRHDQELVLLQQKYAQLATDVQELGGALADLADESAAALAAAAALPAAALDVGEVQPAWMGLVAKLSSEDDGDRWSAVISLGETADPAVAAYLIPVLSDKDIFVRMAAARMLGDLGAPEAVPALIDGLEDPEPSVREAVYIALKEITRRDLPFDALSEDSAERGKRAQAWRDWWEKERARFGG